MKFFGILLVFIGLLLGTIQVHNLIVSSYRFEKSYLQYWQLADKSSTITAKQEYISKFVEILKLDYSNGEFASHNAMYLRTANNSFESNLKAVKTLSTRLEEIKGMNPNSFEYNTAIQQITAQEQGEAQSMINVFSGCYTLANYPLVWSWIAFVTFMVWVLFIMIGGLFLSIYYCH